MTTRHSVARLQARKSTETELPFAILESKLTPPPARDGTVPRATLLYRLEHAATPVVAIVAPPGYGKTTLLVQWAEQARRPFVWLSLDQHDNDPAVLLTYIAVALRRVEPVDPEILRMLASPSILVSQAVLPRLAAALATRARPLTLVLDNAELLHDRDCVDAVGELTAHLRRGSQLALAARSAPPLPVELLRAQGRVLELGVTELAMEQREGRALLRRAGLRLPRTEAAQLIRRTEGWPVGLYLAALALQAEGSQGRTVTPFTFRGDDRLVADYLWSELLARLPPSTVTFLTRTAVLDRMCGPLCDAVLQTRGSAQLLDSLERANLLVVALDRHREWYRYHHLFRELLRGEVRRREPDLVGELTRRAAQWHEDRGLPEAAVGYAMEAGDSDRAARLVAQHALSVYYSGRLATLRRWLDWFDIHGLMDRYPAVAALGGCVYALVGRPAAAERLADAAERGAGRGGPPVAGIPLNGWLALLRTVLCRDGVARMRADAEAAVALVPVASMLRPTVLLLLGVAHLLAGDPDRADRVLVVALEVAEDTGAPDTAALILAERAVVAIGREQWAEAEALAARGRAITQAAQLPDYATTALLFAVAARVAIHQGAVRQARLDLARARRLRSQLIHSLPFLAVQTRLELARAQLALAETASARTLLREVDDLLLRRPQLGILPGQAEELRAQLDKIRADVAGASSLTAAELRVLPLLPTHLSFPGIGEHLHLSTHTVKSQARSIYQKLGVSSRGQAILRAQDLGLLADGTAALASWDSRLQGLRSSDQAEVPGVLDRFAAGGDAELAVDRHRVRLDGVP